MFWILTMAKRDARRGWRALLFCAAAITGGVAALVAVGGFADNLRNAVDDKARALIGADLRVSSRQPFAPEVEAWMNGLPGRQARETILTTMGFFPRVNGARLVQIRAITGGFPFYGELETSPAGARLEGAAAPVALVEEGLMAQWNLRPGDVLKIGAVEFTIRGALLRAPGETAFAGVFAPRVYIAGEWLDKTGLQGLGSMASYAAHFALNQPPNGEWVEAERDKLAEFQRVRMETVEGRRRSLGRVIDNLEGFFSLAGCVALLLGGLGVAGAAQLYVRERKDALAVLRCLGATARQGLAMLVVQVALAGLAGALAGAALGAVAQLALPAALGKIVPLDVVFTLSWKSIALGVTTGVLAASLFALPPLLEARRASPLRALRSGFGEETPPRDALRLALPALIAGLVAWYCAMLAARPQQGLWFAAGLGAALLALGGLAWLLRRLARRLAAGRALAFVFRQGLANLDRPRNRTALLTAVLGLGVFLLYTVWLVQAMLLTQAEFVQRASEPDLLFFDIQPDQREGLDKILARHGLQLNEESPVITMRLRSVKGRAVEDIRRDRGDRTPGWILGHEFRATYHEELSATETLLDGNFTGQFSGDGPVPVSIEEGAARDLGVKVGDAVEFDIQGVPVQAVVGSVRRVEWQRLRPNFFLVFPVGALEAAPAWSLGVARAGDAATRGAVLRDVVAEYPNISTVDLSLIVGTLTDIFDRAAFALQFLALFTVAAGVVVVFGTLWTSRHQRRRESALLRALGASARQMRGILGVEYALVGAFGATAGALLGAGGAFALGHFLFEIQLPWAVAAWSLPLAILLGAATSLIAGLAASLGVASHSPLEVLRAE